MTPVTPGRRFQSIAKLKKESGYVALDAGVLNFNRRGTFIRAWLLEVAEPDDVHLEIRHNGGAAFDLWTKRRAIRRVNGV